MFAQHLPRGLVKRSNLRLPSLRHHRKNGIGVDMPIVEQIRAVTGNQNLGLACSLDQHLPQSRAGRRMKGRFRFLDADQAGE